MPLLELSFALAEASLSVRQFAVREVVSSCFEIDVTACSPDEDVDFDAILGRPASFRVTAGTRHLARDARLWTGVCSHIEQVQAEETGLSTYRIHIVPRLWLLHHRRGHRIFQRLSIPEIIEKLLAEQRIEPILWKLERKHPKLELRVQYGESDYAFFCRLLEEAGIAFYFSDEGGDRTVLVMNEAPHRGELRDGGPIAYVDNPNRSAEVEYLTRVQVAYKIRSGALTVHDVDFRRNLELPLIAEASAARSPEGELAQHLYLPGSFVVETGRDGNTPAADDRGAFRHDERAGKQLAERVLEAERCARRSVAFETNAIDLRPGVVFSINRHPRAHLAPERRLLATELSLEGTPGGEWRVAGRAVFADVPFRPPRVTPKPQLHSVQSALVVGPKGEEIHTDEYGRVRVQFFWDREGKLDEKSSCWVRVSQGWAGSGFGMIAIPRVGQEVLVGFLGGDPDQPVVVGRLFNATSRVPLKLPENKAVSVWRGASSPGLDGFNEIRLDDAKGRELVLMQAERNLTKIVKADELETTGATRTIRVGKRLELTTGEASIILEGPKIWIESRSKIQVRSKEHDVMIFGGPRVGLNQDDEEPESPDRSKVRGPKVKGPRKPKRPKARAPEPMIAASADAQSSRGTERMSVGIDVDGTPVFRKTVKAVLGRLSQTRTGRALLSKMARSGKAVRIVETAAQNASCKPDDIELASRGEDGRPGEGCGSTISYNPKFRPAGVPSALILGAQLVRAHHNAIGVRETGVTGGARDEDLKAIGLPPFSGRAPSENRLRRDLKLPERTQW